MKKLYVLILIILIPALLLAQTVTLESFEDETAGATSFTSNGQVFNISSQSSYFEIYKDNNGYGWNGSTADNAFIDNSDHTNPSQTVQLTIGTNNGVPFTLKSMWLFLSNSNLTTGTGTVTITGVRSGATVFTAVGSSLSSVPITTNNGFLKFDMSSYGGADNSNKSIDAFVINTTGDFEYLALDALSWGTVDIATPVTFNDFSSYQKSGHTYIQWSTGIETGIDYFEVERSIDGASFTRLGKENAQGDNSHYVINTVQPAKTASYRLRIIDKEGLSTYSKVITVSSIAESGYSIFPNPAIDYISVWSPKSIAGVIYDSRGRKVKDIRLDAANNKIDIKSLAAGLYFLKIEGQSSSFIKK